MLKVHQLERKKKYTTARRDDRDKYQPAMISEHLNCLFDSCLSEIVSLEVFLGSSVSVLVFLPSWAVTSCVMVLFCRLAVRPDHFHFFALCFLYFSIPVNFQKCHDFSRLNVALRDETNYVSFDRLSWLLSFGNESSMGVKRTNYCVSYRGLPKDVYENYAQTKLFAR